MATSSIRVWWKLRLSHLSVPFVSLTHNIARLEYVVKQNMKKVRSIFLELQADFSRTGRWGILEVGEGLEVLERGWEGFWGSVLEKC